jgi:hypothetical protein
MRRILLAATILTAFALPASAALPEAPASQMASLHQHDDGAEYVWRVFCVSGLRYSYIPASQFPVSNRFEEVSTPQTGDIAWWPEFVAIFNGQKSEYITSVGFLKLADLSADGSAPKYYRMRLLPGDQPGQKPQPGECQRNLM